MNFFKFFFSDPYEPPAELVKTTAKTCAKRIIDILYDYSHNGTRSLEDRCFLYAEQNYWDARDYNLNFHFWNCIGATFFWQYQPGEPLNEALPKTAFWNALSSELSKECQKYANAKFPAGSYVIVSVSSAHWDSPSVSDEEKYLGITVNFNYRCRY